MNEKIINRLFAYLKQKGVPHTRFEKEIGLSNGYLKVQEKRNADLGESVICKIIDNCLDVDIVWLLTGRGSMLCSGSDNKKSELSAVGYTPSATPISPIEESIIYKMYKEKDAEVGALKEEIGAFKLKVSQLEAPQSTSQDKRQSDAIALAFPNDSSVGSIKGSSVTRMPGNSSKKSSAGKT